jgi:pyridoxine 5-phosphate synthase
VRNTVRLGVNIDHVATVRQARRAAEPDPVWAAALAQLGGADGITIHLREDRRHIQDRDLRLLKQTVTCRLNLEMACSAEIIRLALETKPDEVTLVPEKRAELTTEGGLDVAANERTVQAAVKQLRDHGLFVSLFIDADLRQIELAKLVGSQAVEFHTGQYANAASAAERAKLLEALTEAARRAHESGLHVHMGHGLNYQNVQPIAAIPHVEELNIGFSIVARAVFVGMERAVREMREAIRSATQIK